MLDWKAVSEDQWATLAEVALRLAQVLEASRRSSGLHQACHCLTPRLSRPKTSVLAPEAAPAVAAAVAAKVQEMQVLIALATAVSLL